MGGERRVGSTETVRSTTPKRRRRYSKEAWRRVTKKKTIRSL